MILGLVPTLKSYNNAENERNASMKIHVLKSPTTIRHDPVKVEKVSLV